MITAGATAQDLIPGDPREPEGLAAELDRYAHGADEAAARLNALDQGIWVGEAAEAFRAALGELPARLSLGTEAFGVSARALRHYAEELRSAQATAAHVAELAAQARQQSAAYERQVADYQAAAAAGAPAGPAPPPVDPGAETMAAAERMLAAARERVDGAARFATNVLQAQAEQAPDQRSIWESVWHHLSEFGKGFAEASWGLLKFTYHSSPIYAAVDPGGFVEHYQNLGQGIAYGVTHPVAFAKAVADWETWKENPARALGHLGPGLLLTLASGGAGAAARGLRTTRKLKEAAETAKKLDRAGTLFPEPSRGAKLDRLRELGYDPNTPSGKAAYEQLGARYGGVDDWHDTTLRRGDRVAFGSPGLSEFGARPNVVESVGRNSSDYFEGLQAAPKRFDASDPSYRPEIQVYEANRDINVAESVARNNTQYGGGGLDQYHIPDAEALRESGDLQHVDTVRLDDTRAHIEDPAYERADPSLRHDRPITVKGQRLRGAAEGGAGGGSVVAAQEAANGP